MVTVRVFSAGDHYHHMNEEAGELIALLLEKAGYTKDFTWEARIDKMRHCSSSSPPVRLVHYKPYAVVLRIKTGPDSNTDQIVTLQIPDGSDYKAKNLFDQLKGKAKTISRLWRKEVREKKLAAAGETVMHIPAAIKEDAVKVTTKEEKVVPETAEPVNRITASLEENPPRGIERPAFPNLQGVGADIKKLRYVLSKIHLLSRDEHEGKADYLDHLIRECQWDKDGHLLRMCSRVLTVICEAGYVMPRVNSRNKVLSYVLTEEGCSVLGVKVDDKPIPVATPPKVDKIPDMARLLIDSREKVQELADAGRRLDANALRKQAIQSEITKLKEEIDKISKEDADLIGKVVKSPEAFEYLNRLTQHIAVLPAQTS